MWSYLQLHDFDFPVSDAYRHGLHYLRSELVKLELVDAEEPFGPYFHSLAPWLRSDEDKTLRATDQIRKRLNRMARSQATQGELVQRVLTLLERALSERQ